ncbi:hypothetical protein, partial [Streptomyces yangpuensis]|uniref:hypothetical protein n=1 Tax=Streptomyces yangpuensis TaxID=1648182 RepID=UPI003685CFF1
MAVSLRLLMRARSRRRAATHRGWQARELRRRRRAGKACTDALVEVVGTGGNCRNGPSRPACGPGPTAPSRPRRGGFRLSTRYDKQRTDHCGRNTPGALVAQLRDEGWRWGKGGG